MVQSFLNDFLYYPAASVHAWEEDAKELLSSLHVLEIQDKLSALAVDRCVYQKQSTQTYS